MPGYFAIAPIGHASTSRGNFPRAPNLARHRDAMRRSAAAITKEIPPGLRRRLPTASFAPQHY
ncbi:hypothetical protein LC55x_4004 [Lysobacter capsici]|nr:hypothetical protein LC55x_4004 [Lysobacter capsici]